MAGLDQFYQDLSTTDTKKKLTVGQNIINYLEDDSNSIDCEDIGGFIDGLVPWMQSSNFKVSQSGLDIVGFLIDRLASEFKPYLNTILTSVLDRLGDTRMEVREKANIVLCKLMDATVSPQQLFEKISPGFSHKNSRVREEVLLLLQNTLNAHGAGQLTVSKLIPAIVTSTSDPQAAVRDAAIQTLVEIYRHVGEKVRMDLQRKQSLPANKLATLMAKFDEVKTSGNMMPTATLAMGTMEGAGDDEADRSSGSKSAKSRSSSVPAHKNRNTFSTPKPPSADGRGMSGTVRRQPSVRYGSSTGSGQAGAVDEDYFQSAFENVKKVTIFSGRSLEDEISKVYTVLNNSQADWKLRVDNLMMVRSLMVAGAGQYDEIHQCLKTLEYPFESCVKDLRSQVVRECCITIAFLSQSLRNKVDRFLEFLLPPLIGLIQNSAKVMATSGIVCLKFILQNTFSPRFIPIICQQSSSKSKDIRRHICEFLDIMLHTWQTYTLEKHVNLLQDAIKKGIADPDPDARTFARRAYWGFAEHFKDQADTLMSGLDPTYKRALQGEMSQSSSSNSLNVLQGQGAPRITTGVNRSRQASVTGSSENLIDDHKSGRGIASGSATLGRKPSSGIPKWSSPGKESLGGNNDLMTRSTLSRQSSINNGSPRHSTPGRSNSAIDASAARRASVRQQYSQRGRMSSMARNRKNSDQLGPGGGIPSGTPDRSGRPRSRAGGVSQSQPGSRSASPSSIKSYHTYFDNQSTPYGSSTVGRVGGRKRSGIPRSTGTSREPSPNRYGVTPPSRGLGARVPVRPHVRPLMTEQILRQSREAESALADALSSPLSTSPELSIPDPISGFLRSLETRGKSPRKRSTGGGPSYDGFDNSDESETSSLCSEKSFDYGRPRPSDDITDIIANCASTHWADRKDGLIGLQSYFRDGRMLSGSELKRITDIFTKMFMDAHTKVFALFLETLCELVTSHKADLYDWLYVLLTRLLNKLGADLLGSVIHKINRTLDVVRESFSYEEQLMVVFKFIVDQTQTPNGKVKLATLQYLKSLVTLVESADIPVNKDSEMALAKIITWTSEPKSADIRRAAHGAVVSMFNTHTPQMSQIVAQLPQLYQDSCAEILDKQMPSGESPLRPGGPTPMKQRPVQSSVLNVSRPRTSPHPHSALDPDDSENLAPEDVNKSLRLTANAIQNYSFDKVDKLCDISMPSCDLADEKDSGISQVSADGLTTAGIEDKLAMLEIQAGLEAGNLNGNRLANGRGRGPQAMDDMLYGGNSDSINLGERRSSEGDAGKAQLNELISTLQSVKMGGGGGSERRQAMSSIIRMVRSATTAPIIENFRTVLRVLLENLEDTEGASRALVFGVLTEMLKQEALIGGFHAFTELIILKVLQAHKDPEKDVVRAAEACAATMAGVLPPEMVIRVLNPIIKTGDFPVNQAAIKMLTKVVEKQSPESMEMHVAEVMPGLLKAYDNVESSVRKASVFCIVAIHQLVGEDNLQPHLECLNGSKMKLLSLYIKRAQAQSNAGSPRLTPS